jgi:putative GTP pyrophosphokinase
VLLEELREVYTARRAQVLLPLARNLEIYLSELVLALPRIDHVSVRAKAVESFVRKAEKRTEDGQPKYSDPIHQIQDQIGARITSFYLSDIPLVKSLVEKYFGPIESRLASPESPREFDYEGQHYILFIPDDVIHNRIDDGAGPKFFELQIKTLFQHAWSQASHDLAYKSETAVSRDQRRLVAFAAAQAWGADQIFAKLAEELGTKE